MLFVMPPPSLRKTPTRLESIPLFSEAKLVQAIQTLDSTWKRTEDDRASPIATLLPQALCTLLEIAACFDDQDFVNKAHLRTVCTARVLSCVKRFVAGFSTIQPLLGACCDRKCEQRLIHLTLLNFLFRMCRDPEIASSVVKEDLHTFLVRMCTTSDNLTVDPKHDEVPDANDEAFDPLDLMITMDPFDWCYHPLCNRLLQENSIVYFIPMGVRPLICLFRGTAIPTDEISEFRQQPHESRGKRPKRRKLPSIFTFAQPGGVKEDVLGTKNEAQDKLPPLCCEDGSKQKEIRALWTLILNDNARIHLALRSLIALGTHLPRVSAEYKVLVRERDHIRRVLMRCICSEPRSYNLENAVSYLNSGHSSSLELLQIQSVATKRSTLKRMISSALSIFTEVESTKHSPTGERALRPIENPDFSRRTQKREKSLQQRLSAASEAAKSELARRETRHFHLSELDRSRQRLKVQKACADVESLRKHLVNSLEVLCTGRDHPDPQQPFSEWIKSLPTLETLERERQYQQEMRQRQVLEQQYQREAQRRREHDECLIMQINDFNIPEENEVSKLQQKQQQFLQMQSEIRHLEQRDSDTDRSNAILAKRLLQLEDERREGRELERMRREDFYYVERILQAKAKAKEEEEKREKSGDQKKKAIEEQQKHIARMRLLDEEKRVAERESTGMRLEDLFGRQRRFREAERAKEQVQNEWRELKTMRTEEHECRTRWTLWDRALEQQQQQELKQQRAEARRLKRQQQREENEMKAAWVECWDDGGSKYYYNSISRASQWEAPA